MLLCLHEEHAVAIAQGWAKVTGTPMLAAVHSNVGLFHATMAIFNAWCDRMPVIVLGATGPRRRGQAPALDRLDPHRAGPGRDRAPVREVGRAAGLAGGGARGAVPRRLAGAHGADGRRSTSIWTPGCRRRRWRSRCRRSIRARLMPPVVSAWPGPDGARTRWRMLREARAAGDPGGPRRPRARPPGPRGCASPRHWARAWSPTSRSAPRSRPTIRCMPAAPACSRCRRRGQAIAEADVILSLDWVDLAGTLQACDGAPAAQVIQVSLDHALHNGWSMDHQGLPPVDLFLAADPDAVALALAALLPDGAPPAAARWRRADAGRAAGPIVPCPRLAAALRRAVGDRPVSLLHLPLSWDGASWPFRHPLDFLGSDGGGGIGGGPGISVGAALALRGTGRLPVSICGDGDFLMGVTALWTAAHYRIPLLLVVANNQSFFNDEVHQERMARAARPAGREQVDRHAHDRSGDRPGRAGAGAGRAGLRPGARRGGARRGASPKRSRRSRRAASPWSMCGSRPATRRRWPAP